MKDPANLQTVKLDAGIFESNLVIVTKFLVLDGTRIQIQETVRTINMFANVLQVCLQVTLVGRTVDIMDGMVMVKRMRIMITDQI